MRVSQGAYSRYREGRLAEILSSLKSLLETGEALVIPRDP